MKFCYAEELPLAKELGATALAAVKGVSNLGCDLDGCSVAIMEFLLEQIKRVYGRHACACSHCWIYFEYEVDYEFRV